MVLHCLIGGDIDKYSKWTSYIPILEHELNSTKNATTGFMRNKLHYMMPLRSISNVIFDAMTVSNATAEDLMNGLQEKCKAAI